ncbi:hypothetical protein ABH941_006514, partial [Streptacidiphilus sp. EB103A]
LFHAHPTTSTCVRGITHTETAERQSLHHHALTPDAIMINPSRTGNPSL